MLETAEVAWPFNIKVPPPSLLKSPGSSSSHVVNTSCPESAHPPVLLPWHFQENPSRLEACRINSREKREGGGGETGNAVLNLTGFISSFMATDAHRQHSLGPKCLQHPPLSQSADHCISVYSKIIAFFPPRCASSASLYRSL